MTIREKRIAMGFGLAVGAFVAWRVGEAALKPFIAVREERDTLLAELDDLQNKVNIDKADLGDYAALCALMPEHDEELSKKKEIALAGNVFRARVLDLVENHPEIKGLRGLQYDQVSRGEYTPPGLKGSRAKKASVPKLNLELSAEGDLERILRFMLEIYKSDDLIYITDANFDPVVKSKTKTADSVKVTFDLETIVIERDEELLAKAPTPRKHGARKAEDTASQDADPDSGESETSAAEAVEPGDNENAAEPSPGAGDDDVAKDPAKDEALADGTEPDSENEGEKDTAADPAADLEEEGEVVGTRLAMSRIDYDALLGWKPFDGYMPPPPPPPDPVAKKPEKRPKRQTERPRDTRREEPKEEWLVKGYFRGGKGDIVLMTRAEERSRRSSRRNRRNRGREEDEGPKRLFVQVGDDMDEGKLEMVHRLGAVVRRKEQDEDGEFIDGPGKLYLYRYGKPTSDRTLVSEAHKFGDVYREVQLAMKSELDAEGELGPRSPDDSTTLPTSGGL